MKRILLAVVFVFCVAVAGAWAQSAKVVDVKGEVTVRMSAAGAWQKIQINMLLEKDAEVQTQKDSQCTLAFDEALKNILTLQGDSRIKIQNVSPGNVFLPQGRVFTLIGNMPKDGEQFQVRTPTGVAGARGTGWLTSFVDGKTVARVFDHRIFLRCEDAEDNEHDKGGVNGAQKKESSKDIEKGFGAEIGEDCSIGDPFPVTEDDWREWNGFVSNANVVVETFTRPGNPPTTDPPGETPENPSSRVE